MKTFGIGIAGAGVIGRNHADALSGIEGARLVAVCDPVEEAGRSLATAHVAEWDADLGATLRRSEVDVVIVGTPSGLHAEQSIAASMAGKHVITEKPMATTLADADRMIAAAETAGVTLSVIFQSRFGRDAVRLKRAVEEGLFGRPVLGNAVVHWHRTQEYYDKGGWRGTWALDGGGALMNQSIHTIDLLQWVMGPVERVAAYNATLGHAIETEDTASAALRFGNGALGMVQGTTAAERDWPTRVEIQGTEGRAVLERQRLTTWEPNRAVEVLSDAELARYPDVPDGEPFALGHRRQLNAILAALRAGETPPVTGQEAKKAIEIILAIYASARDGAPVTIAPIV